MSAAGRCSGRRRLRNGDAFQISETETEAQQTEKVRAIVPFLQTQALGLGSVPTMLWPQSGTMSPLLSHSDTSSRPVPSSLSYVSPQKHMLFHCSPMKG